MRKIAVTAVFTNDVYCDVHVRLDTPMRQELRCALTAVVVSALAPEFIVRDIASDGMSLSATLRTKTGSFDGVHRATKAIPSPLVLVVEQFSCGISASIVILDDDLVLLQKLLA